MINGDHIRQFIRSSFTIAYQFLYDQYICLISVTIQDPQIQNRDLMNFIHIELPCP